MKNLPFLGVALLAFAAPCHSADYVSMSGEELYGRFCASCHGVEANGDGPVAKSLNVEVPNLRLIARRAGGTFPRERVIKIIDGRHIIGAHGTRTMPIWGEDLSRVEIGEPNAQRAVDTVIVRIVDYLWRLQRPNPE
jgi:mono/diheme cytochrome c family protein